LILSIRGAIRLSSLSFLLPKIPLIIDPSILTHSYF
jgi:hypothetical protein